MRLSLALMLMLSLVPAAAAGEGAAIPRVPKIAGDWVQLCTMPNLGELAGPNPKRQHVVDHGFVQDDQGEWTVWACIRGTAVSRLLYGWRGPSLTSPDWTPLGVVARASADAGEGLRTDADGQVVEKIGAPHFLKVDDRYYCFYHSNGMRAMTSTNGRDFKRPDFGGARGNLVFHNGGRDIMVAPLKGKYYAYSTISLPDRTSHVSLRTSSDLMEWSPSQRVCEGGSAGSGPVSSESPFVVEIDGYYYLFRASSMTFKTYVYRSLDPTNFGLNDDSKLIAELPLKAPELVLHDGQWRISDLHNDRRPGRHNFQGIRMAPIEWVEDSQAAP